VVTSRQLLDRIGDLIAGAEGIDSYSPVDPRTGKKHVQWSSTVMESTHVLREAPVGIFVENRGDFSGGRRAVAETPGDMDDALVGYSFELIGLGAAIQNMWLTAHAFGLAGVFMGDVLIAETAIRALLGMDGDLAGLGNGARPPKDRHLEPDRVVVHSDETLDSVSEHPLQNGHSYE